MKVSGAGVKSSIENVLLDICQGFEGYTADCGLNTNPITESRGRLVGAAINGQPLTLLRSQVQNAPAMVWSAGIARAFHRYTSQAASYQGLTSSQGNGSAGVKFPSHQLFTGAGVLPIPLMRPLRRYTFLLPARISALAGGAACIGTTDGGLGEGNNAPTLFQGWRAWLGENGGRWTAIFRRTALGALTIVGDSGILGNAVDWVQLGMRYTEGPNPTLEWLVDGVPRFAVSGTAWQPQPTSESVVPVPTAQVLTLAGTVMETTAGRFIVEEV